MKNRRPRGWTDFIFQRQWGDRNRTIVVSGTISPPVPERGPTHDCGGTPAEPPCIEDLQIVLVHRMKNGELRNRKVPDKSGALSKALEETILEHYTDLGRRGE